jgi:hypothetical protein
MMPRARTQGGNLGKINPNNTLSSRAELARLWGDLIQLVLIHGVSHLQDYGARFGVPSSAPAALGERAARAACAPPAAACSC